MAESSSASTHDIGPLGFVDVAGAGTALLRKESDRPANEQVRSSGGTIFTEHDMPSLEELLEAHAVNFVVLERDPSIAVLARESDSAVSGLAASRTFRASFALATPAVMMGVGVVLTTSAGLRHGLHANPYVGFSLFLSGCVLLATAILALRDSGWIR
jgi:hypothetical protein